MSVMAILSVESHSPSHTISTLRAPGSQGNDEGRVRRKTLYASGLKHGTEEFFSPDGDRIGAQEFEHGTLRLRRMFGKHGLLVIEPRDMPRDAFDVLPRWLEQGADIRAQVRSVQEHLSDIGVDATLDPAATLMFQLRGDRRVAMADDDPVTRVTDLSPGALLRPLWQDACLPTIGFVAGPGEVVVNRSLSV